MSDKRKADTNSSENERPVLKRCKLERTPRKSPLKDNNEGEQDLRRRIAELSSQLDDLNAEIERLRDEESNHDDLDTIIDKLHLYNDVKDTAQMLVEKMANLKCLTIREMHQHYGVGPDEYD